MLSNAQTGRSQVISCHLRDICGYQSTVGQPQHRSNWIMEYDSFDEHGIITLAMVTIVMLLNDIPQVSC